MAKKKITSKERGDPAGGHARRSAAVDDFLVSLRHPNDAMLREVRRLVLAAHPSVEEGIKWNSVSFWMTDWFATYHLRAKAGLVLVLHCGAKVKAATPARFVEDPAGIAHWLAHDRCTVQFDDIADVKRKATFLKALVKRWVEKMAEGA